MLQLLSSFSKHKVILLLNNPLGILLALLFIFILRRVLIRLFFPASKEVAARIPTYLPFGVDFIVWSVYHNVSNQDIIFWNKLFRRYGRGDQPFTVEAVLGSDHVIFTADHENTKAVLATQFTEYGKGAKFHRDWKPFLGDSIFATDGRQWQDARRLIRPLFLRERIEELAVFEKHTVKLLKLLGGMKVQQNHVDVVNFFFRFTLDVATDFLLGAGVNSLDNPKEKFAIAFAEVQRMQQLISVSGPLQPLLSKKSYLGGIKIVNSFVEQFIHKTLALPLEELEKLARNDKDFTFLSALALYTRDAAVIRDQLVAVLLAGRDTTAATLSWVIYELSGRPDIVRKLRAEIISCLRSEDTPSFADLKSMKYLQAILSETLRLYPAVPFNMRIALQDTTLPHGGGIDGNHTIHVKKNTVIAYSPLVMQRRKDLYPSSYSDGTTFPDPLIFEPERWLHSSPQSPNRETDPRLGPAPEAVKAKSGPWMPNTWSYIPFNGGPRICIGQQFAITEMGYTLVRIFQKFTRVERRMKDEDCGVLKTNIVLTPRRGVTVCFFEDNVKSA